MLLSGLCPIGETVFTDHGEIWRGAVHRRSILMRNLTHIRRSGFSSTKIEHLVKIAVLGSFCPEGATVCSMKLKFGMEKYRPTAEAKLQRVNSTTVIVTYSF